MKLTNERTKNERRFIAGSKAHMTPHTYST